MRWLVGNRAFADALRRDAFRIALSKPGVARALAGAAMSRAQRFGTSTRCAAISPRGWAAARVNSSFLQ
jgi:hypothetical protein